MSYEKNKERAVGYKNEWHTLEETSKVFKRQKKNCIFYTDAWEAFAKVLPKSRHIVGKACTHITESNNSNTRHHLCRFTRKTKVVSRSENAVDSALRLSLPLTGPVIFSRFQQIALELSIKIDCENR